jgi:hypothetical protein
MKGVEKVKKVRTYEFIFPLFVLIILSLAIFIAGSAKDKSATTAAVQESPKKIIYTTTDLKIDYEVVGILSHYQEFASFGLKDPLLGAIKKGTEEFEKKAAEAGADAVVGIRYEFANRTEKDEGRLLIYGTMVKFK